MTESGQPRVQYVEARRVLLDALTALQPHIDAIVLIGAQAVYLRTTGRLPGYQPFTTDADLVVDPALLADVPLLGDTMTAAGFTYTGEPGIWEQRFMRPGLDSEVRIPVDLIVPEQIAPKAGRRGARLPGGHGNRAARKTTGVEGALADHSPVEITSLEPDDTRAVVVHVAGSAALLVSKAFKLGERLDKPERLQPKDAGDVYRLFDATSISDMTATTRRLLVDERSAGTTERALGYLRQLFATPRSPGIDLATRALAGVIDAPTVASTITSYTRELLTSVAE